MGTTEAKKMPERFMFTSESVNEGHPDKLADQCSDAIVDACFAQDPDSHVACETCTGTGFVMVFGEITTKVDRSAAYYCRWIAKSLVAQKLCKRCIVQVSYAIGVPHPLSVFVDAYGSGGENSNADLLKIVEANFDMRAGMLVRELNMLNAGANGDKYKKTACYGHFGNAARPADEDFTWEIPKTLTV